MPSIPSFCPDRRKPPRFKVTSIACSLSCLPRVELPRKHAKRRICCDPVYGVCMNLHPHQTLHKKQMTDDTRVRSEVGSTFQLSHPLINYLPDASVPPNVSVTSHQVQSTASFHTSWSTRYRKEMDNKCHHTHGCKIIVNAFGKCRKSRTFKKRAGP